MRPASLLALCVVLALAVVVGLVAGSPMHIAVLEVFSTVGDRPEDGCGDGPPAILLSASREAFLVGEELHSPVRLASVEELQRRLHELKRARPERALVVVQVDDDVSYARLARVIDVLKGEELLATDLFVGPKGPLFTEREWARPSFRR